MSEISFACDDVNFSWVDEWVISSWLEQVVTLEKSVLISLSYVFCSDEKLLEINKTYLQHDYYTDVITFDLSDGGDIEGEIYISLDRIKDHAAKYQSSFDEELCRVVVHGLLHLIGYDDKTEADQKTMRSKESNCLSLLQEVPRGTFTQ